jgi:AcrR family transcriptional regulator
MSKFTNRYTFRRARTPTRQRILDAAYVFFRQKGFTRVNVDEIAPSAEATKRV